MNGWRWREGTEKLVPAHYPPPILISYSPREGRVRTGRMREEGRAVSCAAGVPVPASREAEMGRRTMRSACGPADKSRLPLVVGQDRAKKRCARGRIIRIVPLLATRHAEGPRGPGLAPALPSSSSLRRPPRAETKALSPAFTPAASPVPARPWCLYPLAAIRPPIRGRDSR